jgi:hypothetical protein
MKNSELLPKSSCEKKGVLHHQCLLHLVIPEYSIFFLVHESQYMLHFDDKRQMKLKEFLDK